MHKCSCWKTKSQSITNLTLQCTLNNQGLKSIAINSARKNIVYSHRRSVCDCECGEIRLCRVCRNRWNGDSVHLHADNRVHNRGQTSVWTNVRTSSYGRAIDFVEDTEQCFDEPWREVGVFLQHVSPGVTLHEGGARSYNKPNNPSAQCTKSASQYNT